MDKAWVLYLLKHVHKGIMTNNEASKICLKVTLEFAIREIEGKKTKKRSRATRATA